MHYRMVARVVKTCKRTLLAVANEVNLRLMMLRNEKALTKEGWGEDWGEH